MDKRYTYPIKRALFAVLAVELFFLALILALYLSRVELLELLGLSPSQFRFQHEYFLYGLWALPLISLSYLLINSWRNKALRRYATPNLFPYLISAISGIKSVGKYMLVRFGFFFILIALSNPQYGTHKKEVAVKGIDLILAIDVSKSMNALDKDRQEDRLSRAKRSITRLINKLQGNRIGIVVFAGEAIVQLPLTNDYSAAKFFVRSVSTKTAPMAGTSISSAIEESILAFDKESKASKALVVITDGEDHEEGVLDAVEKAVEQGINVHTIGMGSAEGVPIPVYNRLGQKLGYKKDKDGNTVVSKLNVGMLKEIASKGNGLYTKATKDQVGLGNLIQHIDKMEKTAFQTDMYRDYESRFQVFVLLGFLCFLLDGFLSERRSVFADKLKTLDL